MNTISAQTMFSGYKEVHGKVERTGDVLTVTRRGCPEWKTAPSMSRQRPVSQGARSSSNLWLHLPRHSAGEKIAFSLLAAGSTIGVGYGFLCMIELVQKWGQFIAGVRNLVQ